MARSLFIVRYFLFAPFAILFLGFSSKSAYASLPACEFSFNEKSLVIARVESQEERCESLGVVNNLKKLIVLKGSVGNNFKIIRAAEYNECPRPTVGGIQLRAGGEFAGSSRIPKLEIGKTYILSVDPASKPVPWSYLLSKECGGISGEVAGVWDPRVLYYSLRFLAHPIYKAGFFLVVLVALGLGKILPPAIAFGLSIVIVVALLGLIIFVLFRTVGYIMRSLRVRLRKSNLATYLDSRKKRSEV